MKLSNIFFITLFCLSVFVNCKKEKLSIRESTLESCQDNMIFSCNHEPHGDFYIKGKIDGEDFCVSKDFGYTASADIAVTTVTSAQNPVFTPGIGTPVSSFYWFNLSPPVENPDALIPKDFTPSIQLRTPIVNDSIVYPATYYLDKYMKEGDLLMANKLCMIDETKGFFFGVSWGCKLLGTSYSFDNNSTVPVWLSPVDNMQDDMTFRISELSVEYFGTYREYDITFEIECDLYYYQAQRKNNKHFGRLTEGVFRTKFTTPN